MTISGTGILGVGSTTPWATLSVAATSSNNAWPAFVVSTSSPTATNTAFIIDRVGKVGIGTSTPEWQLVVQGGVCITAGDRCQTQGPSFAERVGGLVVDTSGTKVDDPGDDFDVAEIYPASEEMAPAEIVAIDMATTSRAVVKRGVGGEKLVGIVSSSPAIGINSGNLIIGPGKQIASFRPMIALAGRVPVKVNLEGGSIIKGDLISASSEPGVGRKAKAGEQTVGFALDSWNAESEKEGKVLVFVNLGSPRLDSGIKGDRIDGGAAEGSYWWVERDGSIKFLGPLDLAGRDLRNVSAIKSYSGSWSIDENGKLVVKEIEAEKVTTREFCLEDICITKDDFQALLIGAGLIQEPVEEVSEVAPPTEEEVVPPEEIPAPSEEAAPPIAEEPAPEPPAEEVLPAAEEPPAPPVEEPPEEPPPLDNPEILE